jgi:hypothetical protein
MQGLAAAAALCGASGVSAHEDPEIKLAGDVFSMNAKLKAKIHELTMYEEKSDGSHKHKAFKVEFVIDEVVDYKKDDPHSQHNVFCNVSAVNVYVGSIKFKLKPEDYTEGALRVLHCIDP